MIRTLSKLQAIGQLGHGQGILRVSSVLPMCWKACCSCSRPSSTCEPNGESIKCAVGWRKCIAHLPLPHYHRPHLHIQRYFVSSSLIDLMTYVWGRKNSSARMQAGPLPNALWETGILGRVRSCEKDSVLFFGSLESSLRFSMSQESDHQGALPGAWPLGVLLHGSRALLSLGSGPQCLACWLLEHQLAAVALCPGSCEMEISRTCP